MGNTRSAAPLPSLTGTVPKILIIEDNVGQRDFLREVLTRSGYECQVASTMDEGQACFEKARFACALVDLGLPDGDGMTLIQRFGERDPQLVQIVLTGDATAERVINSMRAGAFDYLTKPVDAITLQTAVGRAVDHHAVVAERAELFRLLHEEREHLRARVDAATRDIRQYAATCEAGNARLRSLLYLMQLSAGYYSEEALMRRVFEEVRGHLPLHAAALCDHSGRKGLTVYLKDHDAADSDEPAATSKIMDGVDYDPLSVEVEPEKVFRNWVKRQTGLNTSDMTVLTYPQAQWRQTACKVAFFVDAACSLGPTDREFLDMCAYLLAFEWERGKLLVHVAHQASLGNIATELVRGFIQPLTAVRTAADLLSEIVNAPEASEGVALIEENAERLWRQAQGFRKLSLLREDAVETVRIEDYINQALEILGVTIQSRDIVIEKYVRTDGECLVLNGVALARTFLDLILAALRACDVGGKVRITLRNADEDHVAFELQHSGGQKHLFIDSYVSAVASTSFGDKVDLGLRLAERTVHSCGGVLTVESDSDGRGILRITLPRSIHRLSEGQGMP